MSAEDIEYDDFKLFPTKESAIDWLQFYLSTNEIDNLIKALSVEPCDDAISRQIISDYVQNHIQEINTGYGDLNKHTNEILRMIVDYIESMPPVTPQALKQEPRKGEWLRMSDLSEQEDDRYKCSHCGNVVHYKLKENLYTFNSWCGRCGSDNGRKIEVDI